MSSFGFFGFNKHFAALLCVALLGASTARADEIKNLNVGNQHASAVASTGAVRLKWPDLKGPIHAWWVYYAEGSTAANSAARLCAERPNARRLKGRDARDASIDKLKHLTRYTFLVEAEYRDQPPPARNPKCNYALLLDARTDGVHRALIKNLGKMFAYGVDRGIAIDNDIYLRALTWRIYHKIGRHTPEHMCLHRPNLREMDGREVEYALIDNLKNGELYTVMVEIIAPWKIDPAKKCYYSIAHARPVAHGKAGVIINNINPGFNNVSFQRGDRAVMLRWKWKGMSVRDEPIGFNIYHQQGSIRGDGMSAVRLCSQKPNPISLGRDAREHLVAGLANGKAHTFLIEAKFRNKPDRIDCGYLYHIATTPRPIQIWSLTHKNPDQNHTSASPGSRKVHLKWRREGGGVLAWHIYHAEGTISDVKKLCTERPNPIIIADGKTTEHIVTHLENDTPYTFLVEPYYRGYLTPELRSHCDYVYHAYATPRPN
ncbi:MAG: hypothetical protein ACR2P7_04935 [bacterium]